jgi:hypothetical protein
MADERDPKLSAHYRELGAEEPPRALDDAILAASRKGLKKRSWYGPVALAATLVLVVAVSVQVERQKPDEELAVAQAPAPVPAEKTVAPLPKEERILKSAPAAKPQPARSSAFTPDPPAPAAPAPSADAMRELAKQSEQAGQRSDVAESRRMESAPQVQRSASAPAAAARSAPAQFGAVAALRVDPQRWLEQIAELRGEGKHEDADKLLEEFRKTYPDYRISDEMRAKVERR